MPLAGATPVAVTMVIEIAPETVDAFSSRRARRARRHESPPNGNIAVKRGPIRLWR